MTKKCIEDKCTNSATHTLPVELTDRTDLLHFCASHYIEAKKQIEAVKQSVNSMNEYERIKRLKELFTPEEFNALMEEIGRKEKVYVN